MAVNDATLSVFYRYVFECKWCTYYQEPIDNGIKYLALCACSDIYSVDLYVVLL